MSHQHQDANAKWEQLILDHLKQAEAMSTDEDKSTAGETKLYPDPEGSEPPTDGERVHSDAATQGAQATRHGTVERALGSKLTSTKVDKALMAQNFKHVASGDYEAHSLALQKKTAEETLLEKVRRLTGRD